MAKKNRRVQAELVLMGVSLVVMIVACNRKPQKAVATEIIPTATPTPTVTLKSIQLPKETCEKVCIEYRPLKEPTSKEVIYMAKVIHGEAGICDKLQKSGVAWCVLNRVDCEWYPNTVVEVITQPSQFHGYTPDKVPTPEDYEIAWDVLTRWYNDLDGRTLPKRFLFFHSDRKGKNVFTTKHREGEVWRWELPNIYD